MSASISIRARDGAILAARRIPAGPDAAPGALTVVLLHATLSTSRQLLDLGNALAAVGRVVLLDRRGSGASRLAKPASLSMATHVADVEDLLDREGIPTAVLIGHSYGGVVAIEAAARLPERTAAAVAWEPPYVALADEPTRAGLARIARATLRAADAGGPAAAAETFMRAVAGDDAWAGLPPRAREFLRDEGGGAIADVRMDGLEPEGLAGIRVPVTLLTGDRSEPFYAAIADRLVAAISGARLVRLAGLRHPAPITDPEPVAAAVLAALASQAPVIAPLGPAAVPAREREAHA